VGVHEEVADRGLAEQLVHAGDVAALAEPHPGGAAAEVLLVEVRGDVDLRAQGGPVPVQEGEEAVGGGGGDDLEPVRVAQAAEGPHQIPVVAAPRVAQRLEPVEVHAGEAVVVGLGPRPVELLLGQLDELVEVLRVARLQEVVRHHADERRGERDVQR
jgi:hypothetical protein